MDQILCARFRRVRMATVCRRVLCIECSHAVPQSVVTSVAVFVVETTYQYQDFCLLILP